MIKDDINEAKHLLRKQCRFYANEVEAPRFEQPNGALLWDYERRWVEWTVESDSYLNEVFVNYLRAGLSDFEAADGTPISLKALLYDRYVHWSSFGEDVEERGSLNILPGNNRRFFKKVKIELSYKSHF